jgi:hypothetical protein
MNAKRCPSTVVALLDDFDCARPAIRLSPAIAQKS